MQVHTQMCDVDGVSVNFSFLAAHFLAASARILLGTVPSVWSRSIEGGASFISPCRRRLRAFSELRRGCCRVGESIYHPFQAVLSEGIVSNEEIVG